MLCMWIRLLSACAPGNLNSRLSFIMLQSLLCVFCGLCKHLEILFLLTNLCVSFILFIFY